MALVACTPAYTRTHTHTPTLDLPSGHRGDMYHIWAAPHMSSVIDRTLSQRSRLSTRSLGGCRREQNAWSARGRHLESAITLPPPPPSVLSGITTSHTSLRVTADSPVSRLDGPPTLRRFIIGNTARGTSLTVNDVFVYRGRWARSVRHAAGLSGTSRSNFLCCSGGQEGRGWERRTGVEMSVQATKCLLHL